jgi:hypothetical protein
VYLIATPSFYAHATYKPVVRVRVNCIILNNHVVWDVQIDKLMPREEFAKSLKNLLPAAILHAVFAWIEQCTTQV